MCGILGLLHTDEKPVDAAVLTRACQWMNHRGPDDQGVWTRGPVGLAHRRLSILDLSTAGHQPMISADQKAVIVYNGEVYNFKELRGELEGKGYHFSSHTDTEVLLHGFRDQGIDFVHRLNGQFAVGLWFEDKKELWLLRDRLGIKPLYYWQDRSRFMFASEIKPLLDLGVPVEMDPQAMDYYFSWRYVPSDQSMFKGIKKLAPGHYLKISQRGEVKEECYWSLNALEGYEPMPLDLASQRFYELMEDAVGLAQVSDVPVGAFLSGGIDSSVVVALMRRNGERVKTFTIAMGADVDESQTARRVAGALGVDNEVLALKPDDYCYYPHAVWHLEEPLGDSIIAPSYLLARQAAAKVKVVQLGEGADEILGGYVHQLAMTHGQRLASVIPVGLRRMLARGLKRLPQVFLEKYFPYPTKLGKSGVMKIVDYLNCMDDPAAAYYRLAGLFTGEQKRGLFTQDFYHHNVSAHDPTDNFRHLFESARQHGFLNRLQAVDLRYWNTDYTLLRMDKLTMAHGLEARVPYLDYRLVEFALSLPQRCKMQGFRQKIILREAFKGKDNLPDDVVQAPKKAFFLPIEKCFDEGFMTFAKDILSDQRLRRRGIFNPQWINRILATKDRELLFNKQLMSVLIFEIWAGLYVDGGWKDFKVRTGSL